VLTFNGPAAALAVAASVLGAAACGGPAAPPHLPSASPPHAASPHAAVTSQPPPSAKAVGKPWPQRAILPEDNALEAASQVLDPAAHVLYALVPVTSGSSYVLQAIDLRTGRVRRGASYRLFALALAAGYLWVYGQPAVGRPSVLDEVSPRTLATIRSRSLPNAPYEPAAPVAGPAGSVWVGAESTLLRISVRTGAVLTRAVLPAGLALTALAVNPGTTIVYASAVRPHPGGAVVLEYSQRTGLRLAQSGAGTLQWSLAGAALTALPGGVWVWFRSGMMGQSELLDARSLKVVAGFSGTVSPADSPATGSGTVYDWAMGSSAAYAGGVLWVVTNSGVVACVNPATGLVREQEQVTSEPILVAPDPAARQLLVVGEGGIVAITPPRGC
jgi:hypothetical protein